MSETLENQGFEFANLILDAGSVSWQGRMLSSAWGVHNLETLPDDNANEDDTVGLHVRIVPRSV